MAMAEVQAVQPFLSRDTKVGRLIGQHDWSSSALGPVAQWPATLVTVLNLMHYSKEPMCVAWGPELRLLYNDAYVNLLGERHPQALGAPLAQVWADAWPELEPFIARALGGEAVHEKQLLFSLVRNGSRDVGVFSFSYLPLHDPHTGQVGGVYCSLTETTAAIRAEHARSQEVKRLTALFEGTSAFIALLMGPEHVYQMANQAYQRFAGGRELLGKSVREAFPELVGQGYYEALDEVYRTGTPFVGRRMRILMQGPNDSAARERLVDFIFQPFLDADNAIIGVFIEGSDVTDTVRTEQRLGQASYEAIDAAAVAEIERLRLKTLLEALPVGIAYVDANGKLTATNAEHVRIWGPHPMSNSVCDYQDWGGWWADGSARHGERLTANEWPVARALRGEHCTGDLVDIEPFGMPDVRRSLFLRAAPLLDPYQKVIGAVLAQMDISEQVKAEVALRDSEAKFRTIANAMPQMVWSTLADGYHDYYNKRWYDYTGVPPGSTDGEGWNEIFHPDDRAHAREVWHESLSSGQPYEIEYRLRHHSGQYRWTLGRALPVYNDKGAIIRWMGTCTDIHEHKLAQKRLEESDRRKDEFLAMLAHELRNPLAPISSAAALLSIGITDRARILDISGVISRQARHMSSLIDDLMDVSRVTRGLVVLDVAPVDIKSVIADATEQIRPLLEARAHVLETHVSAERAIVRGDKKRLVQIVANLLSNAAKYTQNGGHIAVRMSVLKHDVVIGVSDNGRGMAPELVEQVFELFAQGERDPDRSEGGLGIGLALVKSLVALHHGVVSARSDGEGKGSEFVVSLPGIDSAVHVDSQAFRVPAPQRQGGARVLVVDDNEDAAELLALVLRQVGHQVDTSYEPHAALHRAQQTMPQVCILDIGLPDMDGYELARRLRAIPGLEHITLIAVTGYGQAEDRNKACAAGIDHHLIKPADVEAITALVAERN